MKKEDLFFIKDSKSNKYFKSSNKKKFFFSNFY